MQLQLSRPSIRQDGPYDVYVNGSGMKRGGDPFAVIQLDDDGRVDLTFDTPEEIDRLIVAAADAKRLLLAALTPHLYAPDAEHGGHKCAECRVSRGHHPEPQCQAISDAATQCTGRARHPLPHRDERGYEWGDDGEDEAAVIARAIEDGTPVILDEDEPRSPMCDSIRPLPHGGELKCTLDDGHYGSHSAVAGERRWLGTGDDARLEDGTRIVPVASRP